MSEKYTNRWRLENKTALVTGASRGIGRAVAMELVSLGATVGIVARNADGVAATVNELRETGGRVFGVATDVSTDDGRTALTHFVSDTLGGIEILVNNAGTNIRKSTLAYESSEMRMLFETNLFSTWEICRALHGELARNGGSIVNIGSVAGNVFVGTGAPYAMTKAALDQLTRYLSVEWAAENIRVNSVNPWATETPLTSDVLSQPEYRSRVLNRTPNGRIADAEDVAALVAFLCLPCARQITGQTIAVDGGFLALGVQHE